VNSSSSYHTMKLMSECWLLGTIARFHGHSICITSVVFILQ